MKKQKINKGHMAEQIAEIVLMRTGLVSIAKPSPKEDLGYDLLVIDKRDTSKVIAVEVKERKVTEADAKKLLRQIKTSSNRSNVPKIILLIDSDKQGGFYSILNVEGQDEIQLLRMDSFTRSLKEVLRVYNPMEFPPYKFYQKANDAKYDTCTIHVDEKFKVLRLHNVSLNPISAKEDLSLEIEINDGISKTPYYFDLASLYYNPKLVNNLFFVTQNSKHIDIPLPRGRKMIVIRVNLLSDVEEYELSLNCRYEQ